LNACKADAISASVTIAVRAASAGGNVFFVMVASLLHDIRAAGVGPQPSAYAKTMQKSRS
jgi:hypothetical protein